MQYNVKDIGEHGVDVDVPVTAPWLSAECPDLDLKPAPSGLTLKGRLEKNGEDFLLRGKLRGALVTPCARCLEPATLPIDADIAVVYAEKGALPPGEQEEVGAMDVLGFEEGRIDLTGELRDEIILALPQSPLCKEDCAGLCPVCGGNRNAAPCACEEKQRIANSKFSELGKLKI